MERGEIREIQRSLLSWYDLCRRDMPWRRVKDPYSIWVSEVMLQQTRVETVIPYFEKFMKKFPGVSDLAQADLDDVLKQWEGLGYYARARNLHAAATQVMEQHGGRVPRDPKSFRALKGVGPYIEAAVLSIAFDTPMAAVDGNVKRVLARFLSCDTPVNAPKSHAVYQRMADALLNLDRSGDHNQSIMELGARVCTPRNPGCSACPLAGSCVAKQKSLVSKLPRRVKKKPIPLRRVAVGAIEKNGKYLICRRKDEGLLGGLYEFPGGGVEAGETPAQACEREILEEVNLRVEVGRKLTTVKHAYTHFKIEMDVFLCRYRSGTVRLAGPVDFAWVRPSDLSRYAFPGANRKFIPMLRGA